MRAICFLDCYWKGKKVSFDRRLAWVNEHEKEIIDFAHNPLRVHRFSSQADKRWLLLAACKEWSPDQDAAQQLFGLIERSGVKHATMTTPYGATRGTIYKHLLEEGPARFCRDKEKCARDLARVLEESIPEVAVEAGKIMNWLRNIARALAKANRGVSWTTPIGFRVIHAPREQKAIRLTTLDRTFIVYEEDERRKIVLRKQVDGLVAHLVHSMDASHMMQTTNRLDAEGIHHVMMIHDSFGVHACNIDLLHRVLREEFVRIYSGPVLQKFLDELREAHPDLDLPDVPQTGDLDIRQVIASPYFFA